MSRTQEHLFDYCVFLRRLAHKKTTVLSLPVTRSYGNVGLVYLFSNKVTAMFMVKTNGTNVLGVLCTFTSFTINRHLVVHWIESRWNPLLTHRPLLLCPLFLE